MALLQLEKINTLIADVDAKKPIAEIKLMKGLKQLICTLDPALALDFVRVGGVRPIWSILGKSDTPALQVQTFDALVIILRYGNALDEIAQDAEEVLPLLMEWALGSCQQLEKALPLLSVIFDFLPQGFDLFMRLVDARDVEGEEKAFETLVTKLTNRGEDRYESIRLLHVILRKSTAVGSEAFQRVVDYLKAADLKLAIEHCEESFEGKAHSESSEQFAAQLDILKMLCYGDKADIAHWKADLMSQQIEESSALNKRRSALEKLLGMTDDEGKEHETYGALQEHIQTQLFRHIKDITEYQAANTELALEKQRRAMAEELDLMKALVGAQMEELKENTNAAQESLMKDLGMSREKVAQQQYIHENTPMFLFYQNMQLKLNEILLACKVLASGMVTAEDKKNKKSTAFEGCVSLAGELVPLPGVKAASMAVTHGLKHLRSQKRKKHHARASGLAVTVTSMERITENCARILAFRYEEQLRQCTPKGVTDFSECGVRRIMEAINSDEMTLYEGDVVTAFVASTLIEHKNWSWDKKTIQHAMDSKKRFGKKVKWNDEAILQKPGIRSTCGKYFSGDGSKPGKYGYRLGTLDEAQRLLFTEDAAPIKWQYCSDEATPDLIRKRSSVLAPMAGEGVEAAEDVPVPEQAAFAAVLDRQYSSASTALRTPKNNKRASTDGSPSDSAYLTAGSSVGSARSSRSSGRGSASRGSRRNSVQLASQLRALQLDVSTMQKQYQRDIGNLTKLVETQAAMLAQQQEAIAALMAKLV